MNKICSVGGVKCPCCNHYSGKDKKKLNRQARAGLKQDTLKEINENLNVGEQTNQSPYEILDFKGEDKENDL